MVVVVVVVDLASVSVLVAPVVAAVVWLHLAQADCKPCFPAHRYNLSLKHGLEVIASTPRYLGLVFLSRSGDLFFLVPYILIYCFHF